MFSVLFLKVDRSRFYFADALANFDPVNDWLLGQMSYLTWREWGQQLPGDSEPIALMTNPENCLLRSPRCEEQELAWMTSVMEKRFANLTQSKWQTSNFRGMLSYPKDMAGVKMRLGLYNALVAPDPGCIRVAELLEVRFAEGPGPKLAFGPDLQIDSLQRQPCHQDAEMIWKKILPTLVVNYRAHQRAHLEMVA